MAAKQSESREKFSFITPPDDELKCLICLEVAIDPLQHEECGKLFCKECLEKHGRDKPCPNCMSEKSHYYGDKKSKRDIQALAVRCSSVERGCEWEGTIGTLEEHVTTCKFTLVPCPKHCKNDNSEVQHFMRKDVEEHLEKDCPNRDYECRDCGEKGTYVHITQVHDETCGKKILPCPNAECTETEQRQDMKRHLEDCDYAEIPCKYRKLGCAVKMKKSALSAHEEDEDRTHFQLALDAVNSQQDKINSQADELTLQQNEIKLQQNEIHLHKDKFNSLQETSKNKELLTFALSEFQKKIQTNEVTTLPPFYTSGYHMALRVDANGAADGKGTHVSIYIAILDGKYNDGLKWPFVGSVTFTLLNQLVDKHHHTITATFPAGANMRAGTTRGFPTFIAHSQLALSLFKNTLFLKDDTLYFRVSVEMAADKPWLECTAK